eukprot:gene11437-21638_t
MPFTNGSEQTRCLTRVIKHLREENYESCNCKLPCHEVKYEKTISYSKWPSDADIPIYKQLFSKALDLNASEVTDDFVRRNFLRIDVYYGDMMYSMITEEESYSFGKLIGDIGGYMGLLVGASVFSLLELIVLIGQTIFAMIATRTRRVNVPNQQFKINRCLERSVLCCSIRSRCRRKESRRKEQAVTKIAVINNFKDGPKNSKRVERISSEFDHAWIRKIIFDQIKGNEMHLAVANAFLLSLVILTVTPTVRRYLKSPSLTKEETVRVSEMKMPAITVCGTSFSKAKVTKFAKEKNLTVKYNWIGRIDNMEDILWKASSLEDIAYDNNTMFIINPDKHDIAIERVLVANQGYCYKTPSMFSYKITNNFDSILLPKAMRKRLARNESELSCTYSIYESLYNSNYASCNCELPCTETRYNKYSSSAKLTSSDPSIHKHIVAINVFFGGMEYEKITELKMYTTERFVGEIGGQMGIWIGASIFSLFELIYLFVQFAGVLCRKKRSKPSNLEKGMSKEVNDSVF